MDGDSRTPEDRTEESSPRYVSLSDYVRLIRRQGLIVLGITLLFGACALGLSLLQEESWDSQAMIEFRDPLQDLSLLGDQPIPERAPATRAQINADLITTPRVARRAQKTLETRVAPQTLLEMIDVTVDLNTAQVTVTASSEDPVFAANVGNAFAESVQRIETREQMRRLEQAEETLRDTRRQVIEQAEEGEAASFDVTGANAALRRVQNLMAVAEPVTITERARVPDEKASPKPGRNAGLGLAVGLAIGLIAAFVRDVLDRRIRNAHEAHQALDLPVLGRIPDTAFGSTGLVKQNGLVTREEDFEPFRVLQANLSYLAQDGPLLRSVLVTSGLPGEGKSTVSLSLASAAVASGSRALLVECDLRRPSLAQRLGMQEAPGLSDYLRGSAGPQDVMRVVDLYEPWNTRSSEDRGGTDPIGKLVCITAGSASSSAIELLDSERFRKFLTTVSHAYDLVVIDGSPILAVADPLRVASEVDALLVCTRALQTTTDEANAVREALENLPARPSAAVVTGLSRSGPDAYGYYYGY